jgi:hypothetical protein
MFASLRTRLFPTQPDPTVWPQVERRTHPRIERYVWADNATREQVRRLLGEEGMRREGELGGKYSTLNFSPSTPSEFR